MKNFQVVLFILVQTVLAAHALRKNYQCTIPGTNNLGVCVEISECEEAIRSIPLRKPIERCGFEGKIPIVCCQYDSMPASQKTCYDYFPPLIETTEETGGQFFIQAIGGEPAFQSEFPHMVALGYGPEESIQWLCGGTLISRQHVLTAAHCLVTRDFGPVRKVLMGTIHLVDEIPGADKQIHNVKSATQYPEYKVSSKYHDIAIVVLENPVQLSDSIRPACLNRKFGLPKADFDLVAMGWGKTQFTGSTSTNLIKVDLVMFNNSFCGEFYDVERQLDRGIVEDTQLCAGGPNSQVKDTCHGDSGGPLQFTLEKRFFVAGVTSFGRGCGIGNTPGIYTRVSKYIDWIESVVWR